ncbi:MAG: sensor histidine kinase [Bacteroidales bacterium]|nr:sensor histidine kinase [Bacteroidales bacterium]
MVCLTIFFISLKKKNATDILIFALLTASLSALTVGYKFPFQFDKTLTGRHYLELLLVAILCEALVYSVIYMIEYAITARRNAESEKDRADLAKFQYLNLKQQVNPHFLFNSLNILDALVLDGKDREASTYIHKLAGIYRYMLKNEEETTVSLRDEMTYVEMYCDLLKVRFQEGFNLLTDIPEEDLARFVIPCSVQLLIENATKHNAVSPERPLNVSITSDGDSITVTNNLIPRVTRSQSSGLGLNYIREQYKERSGKTIVIEKTDDSYTVKLPML